MKLTKYCLLPWAFMQIHAGGMMQCCAVAPDTDLGDFILDYCDGCGEEKDPFNSEGLQAVRTGLLTGNLRPMCRNCFYVPHVLITTTEFEKRLKDFLKERRTDIDVENIDLTKVYAYSWMAISFTNRCNLSCIYCVQSELKDKNPYFKMDFPYEHAQKALDYFASLGIDRFSTCVEGEATLYKHWYDVFSEFHRKYPHIKLRMTTNLNREFSEEELDLLTEYQILDISIDSLNPSTYSEIRVNGKLELLLKNLDKIDKRVKDRGITGPKITLHTVLSSKTWTELEALADFAFSRGYGVEMGNYEERTNTRAYKEKLLVPVIELPYETQCQIRDIIQRVKDKAQKMNCFFGNQGDLFGQLDAIVEADYNKYKPYDDNPLSNAFYKQYPKGKQEQYLDIVYDDDNISHEGILFKNEEELIIENIPACEVIVREIQIYKEGKTFARYNRRVLLRYRKKLSIEDGTLKYRPSFLSEDVDAVMVEFCDWNYI